MDNPAPVTFACDWCQEQKESLHKFGPEKACKGIDCTHILCDTCNASLATKYNTAPENQHFFYCHRCRAFYEEKHKVCWFNDLSGWAGVESFTNMMAQYFIEQYGGGNTRQLPDATVDTMLPNSAKKTAPTTAPTQNPGMSQQEKAEFKRQLKAANTADEMRQVVQTKLQKGQKIKLNFDNFANRRPVYFTPESKGEITPLLQATCTAVEEVFFEEMHPLVFEQADYDTELAKFAKYAWAEGSTESILRGIFKVKKQLDKDGRVFRSDQDKLPKFQYIKNRVAQVSGENRLFGGKNDFSKRLAWSADKTLEGIIFSSKATQYMVGGIIAVVVLGGIYYRYFAKSDAQDDEADQEDIKNDDAQDVSVSTE